MIYLLLVVMVGSILFLYARALSTGVARGMSKRACFGAGCYWGTEKFIKKDFGEKAFPGMPKITSGQVGFMGGTISNPTYKQVCSGTTNHVEVYDFEFDGDEKTYEALVKHFFMFHDPTTENRQGNDRGTQYASAIFVYDEKQREIATRVKDELESLMDQGKVLQYKGKWVVTSIKDATEFYPAHEDHQEYLEKNPEGYCNHFYRFKKWPSM